MTWTPSPVLVVTVLCLDCLVRFGACQLRSEDLLSMLDDGIRAFEEAAAPTMSTPRELLLPQRRTTELASLNVNDTVVKGSRIAYILQSTTTQFHLVLQLQDVGDESFCWMAVINARRPWELAWRAPCSPVKASSCSVRFTTRGDLQLFLPEPMTVAWQTNTSGLGAKLLRLLDYGNWLLLRANTDIVWQTSEHPVPKNCLIPGPILLDNDTVYAPPSPQQAESGDSTQPESLVAALCLISFVTVFLVF